MEPQKYTSIILINRFIRSKGKIWKSMWITWITYCYWKLFGMTPADLASFEKQSEYVNNAV